jgi:hypothetical protein
MGNAHLSADRRNRRDPAMAPRTHPRHNSENWIERSPEHHVHRLPEIFRIEILELADLDHAGNRKQEIDPSIMGERLRYHGRHVAFDPDIADDWKHLRSRFPQLGRCPVQFIDVSRTDHQAAVLLRQLTGNRESQTPRSARHQGHLTRQVRLARAGSQLAKRQCRQYGSRYAQHPGAYCIG